MAKDESVCVIIFDNQKNVLLTKRRDIPVWVLPGGGIEENEAAESAALREAFEELNCKVELVRKIAEYLPVNKMTRLTHFFEAKIISGTPHKTDETLDVAYFPIQKLPIMPPPYKGWINDAISANNGIILRKKIEGVNYLVLLKLFISHPILVGRYLLTKIGIHINKT